LDTANKLGKSKSIRCGNDYCPNLILAYDSNSKECIIRDIYHKMYTNCAHMRSTIDIQWTVLNIQDIIQKSPTI